MDYKETLDYLLTKLPMYSRIGAAAYKEDLDNTLKLCAYLDNPHTRFKTIHIAGTNGKGSVSHMLASIFQMAGYKTGLYTSPHLYDFRERIRIDEETISEGFVVAFTEKILPLVNEIEPSFFEITVAMAFDYFASEHVDIAIIETGLGGRLDSTNIINPELSVITNISWDHMDLLGKTIERIATEKAGIIKKDTPVVIGEVTHETKNIFSGIAHERNARIAIASETRQVVHWKWENHELVVTVSKKKQTDHKTFHLDLAGIYQVKNLLTVLEACSQMRKMGWKLEHSVIDRGLRNARKLTAFHGRWELIHHAPDIVLDVAHNEAGIKQLTGQIEVTDHHELHLVLGFVRDKEINSVLSLLPTTAHYYFTQANIPRALDAESLRAAAEKHGLKGKNYADVNAALAAATKAAGKKDLIVVCGSVFLVGEVKRVR